MIIRTHLKNQFLLQCQQFGCKAFNPPRNSTAIPRRISRLSLELPPFRHESIFEMRSSNIKKRGFALVEIIVAISLTMILLSSVLQFVIMSTRAMRAQRYTQEATLLLAEVEDAVKFLRDASWATYIAPITTETTYYLSFSGNNWSMTTNNPGPTNNLYTRTVVFHQVLRDASGNVVGSGWPADANSRRVTATVSWTGLGTTQTITNDFYVNNILRN